jgi:hypothetical protein
MSNVSAVPPIASKPLLGAPEQVAPVAYVDWPPIFAGAFVAVAISTVMTTFGAAIGLSATSPISGSSMSGTAWIVATGIWVLWIAVSSFVAGGYLAGRMRRRIHDASEHESDVRDGVHGLVVWAIGALLLGYLAASSITGLTKSVAGTAATGAMTAITAAANPVDDAVSRITRAGPSAKVGDDTFRQDATAILKASAANGSISDEDKGYLSAQIATHTGLSPQDASKRIDDAMGAVNAAKEKAKQAAESARKIGVLLAFLTAASLAVSAAAAWWAATVGGKHRDEGIDLSHLTTWR